MTVAATSSFGVEKPSCEPIITHVKLSHSKNVEKFERDLKTTIVRRETRLKNQIQRTHSDTHFHD